MRTFDVQSVEMVAPFELAFDYIADPANLPEWTHAFTSIDGQRATMRTPVGTAEVELNATSRDSGTIDWTMRFPNALVARAFSRVVPITAGRVSYSFILQAPPVPLEQLEGTLAQQSTALASELAALTRLLERRAGRNEAVASRRGSWLSKILELEKPDAASILEITLAAFENDYPGRDCCSFNSHVRRVDWFALTVPVIARGNFPTPFETAGSRPASGCLLTPGAR